MLIFDRSMNKITSNTQTRVKIFYSTNRVFNELFYRIFQNVSYH